MMWTIILQLTQYYCNSSVINWGEAEHTQSFFFFFGGGGGGQLPARWHMLVHKCMIYSKGHIDKPMRFLVPRGCVKKLSGRSQSKKESQRQSLGTQTIEQRQALLQRRCEG